MSYLSPDFITFFNELANNNHREWFHANKKTYESAVKEPFRKLVADLIDEVHEDDPDVRIEPKDAIFRINRDIRFSKDKTPYKTNVSAVISPGGRKDKTTPGFYFEVKATGIGIYGGLYMLDKHQLLNVRNHIAGSLEAFDALLNEPAYKKEYGGTLLGDQHKRIPPEFRDIVEEQPLIANKAFYYHSELPAKHITSEKLLDTLMEKYFIAKPMKEYLTEALGGE